METQSDPAECLGISGHSVRSVFGIQAETIPKESETRSEARIDPRQQQLSPFDDTAQISGS
jgi:hypothetical protein